MKRFTEQSLDDTTYKFPPSLILLISTSNGATDFVFSNNIIDSQSSERIDQVTLGSNSYVWLNMYL